jgi:hypothetical protein
MPTVADPKVYEPTVKQVTMFGLPGRSAHKNRPATKLNAPQWL